MININEMKINKYEMIMIMWNDNNMKMIMMNIIIWNENNVMKMKK